MGVSRAEACAPGHLQITTVSLRVRSHAHAQLPPPAGLLTDTHPWVRPRWLRPPGGGDPAQGPQAAGGRAAAPLLRVQSHRLAYTREEEGEAGGAFQKLK